MSSYKIRAIILVISQLFAFPALSFGLTNQVLKNNQLKNEIELVWSSEKSSVSNHSTITVGDINSDGIIEIIGSNTADGTITIFNGNDGSVIKSIVHPMTWQEYIAIGDVAINGCSYIFVASDSNITAFDCNLNLLWETGKNGILSPPGVVSAMGLADFNGDGQVELYYANEIRNALTGEVIIKGSGTWNNRNNIDVAAGSVAYNISDSHPGLELISGLTIYDVDIAGRSISVIADRSEYFPKVSFVGQNHNFTSIADYDLDGSMDIIANGAVGSSKGNPAVFYWNVANDILKTFETPNYWKHGTGRVAIAETDEKEGLNSFFVTGKRLYALDENFKLKWELPITEKSSGNTGTTVFDFNGDGKSEIVIRDEGLLYIIQDSVDISGVSFGHIKESFPCRSRTGREYPVVADVNNDGQSEICLSCQHSSEPGINPRETGQIKVFGSVRPQWAPSRKVWNQHGYFNVHVNDDLTIPGNQLSMLDPSFLEDNPAESHPVNGFLKQYANETLDPRSNFNQNTYNQVLSFDDAHDSYRVIEYDSMTRLLVSGNGIYLPVEEMPQYARNFSYDFWAYTEKTIGLLADNGRSTGFGGLYNQNYAIFPHNMRRWYGRGTGISLGTNGISVMEHQHDYIDARITATLPLKGWNHYAVVYEDNIIKLYVNGQLIKTSGQIAVPVMPGHHIGFGYANFDSNDAFRGKLDEYRLWSRSLSAEEINLIKDKKIVSPAMEDLLIYYSFDCGQEAKDPSLAGGYLHGIEFDIADQQYQSDTVLIDGLITSASLSNPDINTDLSNHQGYYWPDGSVTQTLGEYSATDSLEYYNYIHHGISCTDSLQTDVPQQITDSSLVAWYPFNGNANDESGNGNHGVVNRAVLDKDRFGNAASSYFFDGNSSSDPTKISAHLGEYKSLSVSLWMKVKRIDKYYPTLISFTTKDHQNGIQFIALLGNNPYYILDKKVGAIQGHPDYMDSFEHTEDKFLAEEGKWYQVTMTHDSISNEHNLYVNGKFVVSVETTNSLSLDNISELIIGCNKTGLTSEGYGHLGFHGNIDDIKIYNYPLSAVEIDSLFDLPRIDSLPPTATHGTTITLRGVNFNAIDSISIDNILVSSYSIISETELELTIPNGTSAGKLTTYTGGIAYPADQSLDLSNDNVMNDLVAWYPFNGNANDESGNGNHGVVNRAVLDKDRFGNAASSYFFDGNSNSDPTKISAHLGEYKSLSVSLWMKIKKIDEYYPTLISFTTKGNQKDVQFIGLLGNHPAYINENKVGAVQGYPDFIESFKHTEDKFLAEEGKWYQITMIHDSISNIHNLYVNGKLIVSGETTNSINLDNFSELIIGFYSGHTNKMSFHGNIDDVKIYNYPLSEAEIDMLFDLPRIDSIVQAAIPGREFILRGVNFNAIDSIKIDNTLITEFTEISARDLMITIPENAENGTITTYTGGIGYPHDEALKISSDSLMNDLVAWYPFNGNANDESGNGNHSIKVQAKLSSDRFGNESSSYQFDKFDDVIVVPHSQSINFNAVTDSYTVSFWALEADDWDKKGVPIAKDGTPGYPFKLQSHFNEGKYSLAGGPWDWSINEGNFLLTEEYFWNHSWQLITLVLDQKTDSLYFYRNGKLESQNLNVAQNEGANNWNLTIGNSWGFDRPFKGYLDDIMLFNRALSANEIRALYDLPLIVNYPEENTKPNDVILLSGQNLHKIDSIQIDSMLVTDFTIIDDETLELKIPDRVTEGIIVTFTAGIGYSSSQNLTIAKENDELIAWYPFNGNAVDESGNGYNGIISGATLTTDRKGIPDAALFFDGIDDLIETDKAWPDMREGTFTAWVLHQKGNQRGTVFTDGSINVGGSDFLLQTTDQHIHFRADKNGSLNYENSPAPALSGLDLAARWHHVSWSFNDSVHTIYLDGEMVFSTIEKGNNVGWKDPNSYIGARRVWAQADQFFQGKLDEIKIYSRCLTAEEVYSIVKSESVFDITQVNPTSAKPGSRIVLDGYGFNHLDSMFIGDLNIENYHISSDSVLSFDLPEQARSGHLHLYGNQSFIKTSIPFTVVPEFVTGHDAVQYSNACYAVTRELQNQSGTLWSNEDFNLNQSFDFEFSLYLGRIDGGAEGLAFVMQKDPTGTSATGNVGGGLLFAESPNNPEGNKKINPSVAFEFDTYYNDACATDIQEDHVAMVLNGNICEPALGPVSIIVEPGGNVEDDKFHNVRVSWDAENQNLSLYVDENLRLNKKIDLITTVFNGETKVLLGFTAATGATFNEQMVCFTHNQSTPSIAGFNPAMGYAGDTVKITGNGFEDIAALFIGQVKCQNFGVLNDQNLWLVLPKNAQSGKIKIKTPSQSVTSTTDLFISSSSEVIVSIDEIQAPANSNILIPVIVERFDEILNFQFSINWDSDVMQIKNVGKPVLNNINSHINNTEGQLSVSWDDPILLPKSLTPGDTLLLLEAEVTGQAYSKSLITFTNSPTPFEFINSNYVHASYKLLDGSLSVVDFQVVGGKVVDIKGNPVANIDVLVAGDLSDTLSTSNEGKFELKIKQAKNIRIKPQKFQDDFPSKGVTTLDIALIRRHILNLKQFDDPKYLIAADVNYSKSVSTLDIVFIRKVILNMMQNFGYNRLFRFLPLNQFNPASPFDHLDSIELNLNASYPDQDFMMLKLGDVNSSRNSGGRRLLEQPLALEIGSISGSPGDTLKVPVAVQKTSQISGYQFTMSWNPDEISLMKIDNQSIKGYFNENNINNGNLTTSWDDIDGNEVVLSEKESLFDLYFIVNYLTDSSKLSINSSLTPAMAFDGNLEEMNIVYSGGLTSDLAINNSIPNFNLNVTPNPFTEQVDFRFYLERDQNISIEFLDQTGRLIDKIDKYCSQGQQSIRWKPTNKLGNGQRVIIYRIESTDIQKTGKLIYVLN